jgi:uncharacterized NAD(P)/FAD-binding protein YdhS
MYGVIIVGGGVAAATLARLVDDAACCNFAVVHPGQHLGPGRPYSAPQNCWRLNIPLQAADKAFSLLPGLPVSFSQWVEFNYRNNYPVYQGFVPRAWLGHYVQKIVVGRRSKRWHEYTALCTAFDWNDTGGYWSIRLSTGQVLHGRRLVLATGNEAPEMPVLPPWAESVVLIRDPFVQIQRLAEALSTKSLTIIGLGLTMADMVSYLAAHRYAGQVFAVSRSGYIPLSHATTPPQPEWLALQYQAHENALANPGPERHAVLYWFRHLRRQIRKLQPGEHWQWVIDAFRPYVRQVWSLLPTSERQVFLRRLARYWNIHRHRVPPDVAALLQEWQLEGRLIVSKTKTPSDWPRTEALIACTGPLTDLTKSPNQLLRYGYKAGYLQPDPLHLGFQADPAGRLFSEYTAHQRLYTLGPPLRGVWYESTALLEIVEQAVALADLLHEDI